MCLAIPLSSAASPIRRASHRIRRAAFISAIALGAGLGLGLSGCQSVPGGAASDAKPEVSTNGAIPTVVATMKARAQPAPPWMVGRFSGTNLRSGLQNIEIDVSANGRLLGRVADLTAEGQYIGNSRIIWAHGNESIIEQRGNGFRVTQVKDPGNVTEYLRK